MNHSAPPQTAINNADMSELNLYANVTVIAGD